MTENYGGLKNAHVLVGWESEYGTAVSADKDVGIVTDISERSSNEAIATRGMSSRDLDQIDMGNFSHTIDLTCQYQHARLIDLALGAVAHSGTEDPYTHTCTGADDINSFTLEVGLNGTTDDSVMYDGCKINSLTISQDLGGVVTMRAEIFAQDVTTDTSAGTAVVDTLPVLPSGYTTVNTGDAIAQCRAFEITINNNLDKVYKMGSFEHENLLEMARDYTFRFTAAYTDIKERGRFYAGSNSATTPTTTSFAGFNTTITTDLAASNRSLVSTLTDCHYQEWSRPISVGGVILQEMSGVFRTASIVGEDDIASASWE
jgi:hypothetical protein